MYSVVQQTQSKHSIKKMNVVLTPDHVSAGCTIETCGHVWEPYVLKHPSEFVPNKLPPPFDAWGEETAWKLVTCLWSSHSGSCAEATIRACKDVDFRTSRLLQNFSTVFGTVRNKAFASAFRAKKLADKEEAEEEAATEEEEEEEDEADDSDSAHESEEDDDDEEEEVEESNDEESDEDDTDGGEKEETASSSSTSESSEEEEKPKRRTIKRSAPSSA